MSAKPVQLTAAPRQLTEEETALIAGAGLWDTVKGWFVGKALDTAVEVGKTVLNPESEFSHKAARDPYSPTNRANPFPSGR